MNSARIAVLPFVAVILISCMGCSGGSGQSIVAPPTGDLNQISQTSPDNGSSTILWGLWQIEINTATGTYEAVPLRSADFTANVNNLLESKPGNLLIQDMDVSLFASEGRLDCTIRLTHPFTGLGQYNGFDVRGVFLHNGATEIDYDGLTYPGGPDAGSNEASLLNPDGYTRWFNQPEFDGDGSPLLEFWSGKLANLMTPTATLNAYKAFADGLGTEDDYAEWIMDPSNYPDRAIFTAGTANTRRYQLKFPMVGGFPKVDFQYAVIATWEPGDPTLTGSPTIYDPGDFPTSANCEEPYLVRIDTTESSLYNDGAGAVGGEFKAGIEVFDWQGGSVGHNGVPNEVYSIIVNGDFVPGGTHKFTQSQLLAVAEPSTENSSVFQVDIPNCTPAASGTAGFWVIVEAAGLNGATYGQGFPTEYPWPARRASFATGTVAVGVGPSWPDVIYVDDSNTTGIEDGTHSHPYNTIQEGINNNPDQKEIYVDDSGNVYVEYLKMKNNTVLKSVNWDDSDGTNRAAIRAPYGDGMYAVEFNNVQNARIEGFEINPHGSDAGLYELDMILVTNGSNNTIKDCLFTGQVFDSVDYEVDYVIGVNASGCTNLTVQNCRFDNLDKGVNTGTMDYWELIWASSCPGINILNNIFTNIRSSNDAGTKNGWGCYLDSCSNAVLKNNLIHHIKPHAPGNANIQEGFHLISCSSPTLMNNTIDSMDVTDAFFIQEVFAYWIESCAGTIVFKNNIATRIYCNGFPPPLARGVQAVGCTFTPGFCDMWDIGPGGNGQNYYNVTPDATCISLNPQYVDWTNGLYDLQSGSPAQQGDSSIVNWDDTGDPSGNPANTDTNTRSRMGCGGGPGGEFVGLLTP